MSSKLLRPFMRLTVIGLLAGGLGACETIADLDPTGLLSDDSTPAAGDNASTPDLAGLPDAPPTTTPDDQKKVADSLSADGSKAQYDANALRAGTEASAQAPGAAAPVTTASNDTPPSAGAAPPVVDLPPPSAQAALAQPAAAPPPPAAPMAASPPVAADVPMPAAPPPVQTAALAPMPAAAPGAEPAVPPLGPGAAGMTAVPVASDAALGFKPSSAPPLDPSVSKFVSAPILSRYRQTASLSQSAVAAVPGQDGAVIAGLGNPAAAAAAMNGGIAPTAIVYFPGDGTGLTAAARAQVRAAVTAFKAGGNAGTIRVVGHASSRTADMPVEKHLEMIFAKSQQRANAVAQELIHEGVPAAKVVIEAVGDSQPIYYESMPKGEDGNRRAEIFVQS